MKKYINIELLLFLLLSFSSCEKENDVDNSVSGGISGVEVSLSFTVSDPVSAGASSTSTSSSTSSSTKVTSSRSSSNTPFEVTYTSSAKSTTRMESTFTNVWVLQFGSDGTCLTAVNQGSVTEGSNLNPSLTTGTDQTIYIVANGPSGSTAFAAGTTTLSSFERSMAFGDPITSASDIPYVGKISGATVASDGSKSYISWGSSSSPTVTLYRIAAKVSLALTFNVSGYTLSSVKLCNAPTNMYYVYGENISTDFPVTPSSANIDSLGRTADLIPSTSTSGTYTWYTGENRRGTNSAVTSIYDKDFQHTPDEYCTYILVTATKTSGARQSINYYIYPGTNTTTDFEVKRNWDYDITAGIRGNAAIQESAQGIDGRVRMTTSNSYMVSPGSTFTIPVDVKGDANGPLSSEYLTALGISDTSLSPSSVSLLWEDTDGLISNVSDIYNGKVNITLSNSSGNAVIAAYDTNGTTILWSWHIWASDYNPDDGGMTYAYNNGTYTTTFMDRNLGATAVATAINSPLASYGFYYQWGRKDPFPSANATTLADRVSGVDYSAAMYGTKTSVTLTSGPVSMSTATENPTTFYEYGGSSVYDWNSSPNVNLWGNPTTSMVNAKSPYDPCPVGWRVPVYKNGVSPWNGLSGSWSTWSSKVGYPPASGYRSCSNGGFYNVGSSGFCWAASPSGNYGCYLGFSSSGVYPSDKDSRAYGFGVRCCRE